ncbi:unnamed protein product [Prorocentrum cordatum]|uniref:Uncharacterized protein n=1 Tax=Prorocentrum cordatum TaxID=2364126 RepID=A0ABN9VDB6_9DINO|nr:unnamed protein product [Polarella glacialis]
MTVVRPDPCGPSEAKAFADERQHEERRGTRRPAGTASRTSRPTPKSGTDIAALLKGLQDAMTATTAVERAAEQEAEAEATSIDGELSRLLGRARCEAAEEARKRVAREVEARLATFQAAQSRRQAARAALAGKATSSTTAESEESLEQTMQCREKLARAWEEAGRACGEAVKPTEEEMEGGEGWMSWLFTWPFALLVVFWLHVAPLALAFPISSLAFGSSFVWRGLAFYMLARVILHGFLWLEGAIIEQRKWVTENRKWAKTTWKANKKWLVRASMFTSMLIAASVIFAP